MISVETAQARILESLRPLPVETVPLIASLGRGCAEEVVAPSDLPAFDNAAVDGYAVSSPDLLEASSERPIELEVVGVVAAGDAPMLVVRPGTCVRIFTGAVLPTGADAVVMQEDVETAGGSSVRIRERVRPWDGVRLAGEDVRRGTRLAWVGQRVRPGLIGLLAASGFATVTVPRRPRVAVLTTGSELLEPGNPPVPGGVYNSNCPLLEALARTEGVEVTGVSRTPDTLEHTMAGLVLAARGNDVVITTGGVSVGEADLVRAALAALGGTVEDWKVAMKPGKPFAWGRLEGTLWFGLPGNPVSAFVTWWLLVRPALLRLMGVQATGGRRVTGRLAASVTNAGDRRHFLRVSLDDAGRVAVVGPQSSHIQSSLALADGLLDVPPLTTWEMGQEVRVELLP